jgi:hypothetical protein
VSANLGESKTSSRVADTEQLSEAEEIFEEQQRRYAEHQIQQEKKRERVEYQKKSTQRSNYINLKSVAISEILISLILVMIGFKSIDVVTLLIGLPRDYLDILEYLILFIQRVTFFIWIYRLHTDLKNIFYDYPITPIGAVFRYLFPIFLWGIWNTLSTFANRLQNEAVSLTDIAEKIRILTIYSYVLISIFFTIYLFSNNNLLKYINPTTTSKLLEISPFLYFFEVLINVSTNLVDLLLVKTITQAIIRKLKLQEYSYIK